MSTYCAKCGFPQQDCHCDLRAFLAEKRAEDDIVKFIERDSENPPRWLSPADEVLAAERLREIASQAALGYLCNASDAHFAAQTALSLIQSRRATRHSLMHLAEQMREHEAQIATLKAHLQGTCTPPLP